MQKIVLASNNKHKIEEFKNLFKGYEVLAMREVGFTDEIDETGTTFLENSLIKASAVHEYLKKQGTMAIVLSDDSGLCVKALNGDPGVYTARYGGDHDKDTSRKLLLKNMEGVKDRSAYYECVIVKMDPDGSYVHAVGRAFGQIADKLYGESGLTFDPLFISDDLHKTFAQATMEEKNAVSHRGRALADLKTKWKFDQDQSSKVNRTKK